MDIMKLQDILFIGVPETTLSMLTILFFIDGRIPFKNKEFFYKMALSNIVILSIIFCSRGYFNDILYVAITSAVSYSLTFKFVWSFNWRQAFLGASVSLLLLIILEITIYPIIINFESINLFDNRFLISFPTRILQFFTLLIIIKNKISLKDNKLFINEWHTLHRANKNIVIGLLASVFICFICNLNYTAIFFHTYIIPKGNKGFDLNVQALYIGNILMVLAVIILLVRTIRNEEYKAMLKKTPEQFIRKILENSTPEELRNFTKVFLDEVQVAKIVQVQKCFENLREEYVNLTYEIDESIIVADIDYTDVIAFIEHLMKHYNTNTKMRLLLVKEESNIVLELQVYETSEIEFKTFEDYFKSLNELKTGLILTLNAAVNLDYFNQVALFEIIVPIQKYYKKYDAYSESIC